MKERLKKGFSNPFLVAECKRCLMEYDDYTIEDLERTLCGMESPDSVSTQSMIPGGAPTNLATVTPPHPVET